jgi:hypothetical protein
MEKGKEYGRLMQEKNYENRQLAIIIGNQEKYLK